MENEELLPKLQVDLPKPLTDLPLPEKDLPAHANQKFKIKSLHFFIGFLAFSFLIAFIIGGIVLGKNQTSKQTNQAPTTASSPTPANSTADWQTYKNTEIGVQFKYLPGSSPVIPDQSFSEVPLIDLPLPKIDDYASFSIFVNEGQTTLPKFSTKDEVLTYNKGNTKMIKHPPEEYLVSGVKGQKQIVDMEDLNTGNTTFEYIYVMQGNKMYQLRMRYYTENKDQLSKLFDQILSTFKFTEAKPSCRPRPACFDATPRCLMPETSDMCPPSVTPTKSNSNNGGNVCTQEAKQCSDGSWVGRSGPNCEFKCP